MIDPVTAVFFTLGRGAEAVSDLAFRSSLRGHEDEERPGLTPQEQALLAINAGKPEDAPDGGLREAEEARLIRRTDRGQFYLSALGEYLLPDPVDGDLTAEASTGSARAAH